MIYKYHKICNQFLIFWGVFGELDVSGVSPGAFYRGGAGGKVVIGSGKKWWIWEKMVDLEKTVDLGKYSGSGKNSGSGKKWWI